MRHRAHDGLTDYEKWIVDELIRCSTEGTEHQTVSCFEQSYYLGQDASLLATKLFYSSLFNDPKMARWAIDRILKLPDAYKISSLLHFGYSLAVMYKHMMHRDPSLDELMRTTYQKWLEGLREK